MTYTFTALDDPTDDDLRTWCRMIRAERLAECDWRVLEDAPGDRQAWLDYRQQLRDFGDTWTPSTEFTLPDPPA